MRAYETVIGLEVHIQLNTKAKAFGPEKNEFNLSPNENISPVTLALPGTLPVGNIAHLEKAVKLGLALGCQINEYNYFDRKNYFYPDLPKGYQITQDGRPVCVGGKVTFPTGDGEKTIRIHHIHMEEDAGKSSHDQSDSYSLIDYNRAGTPLLELVTEPDFRSGQEVHDFMAYMQKVVQYLDVSDGNMEEGSIRCDCNISVRPMGQEQYGERREVKNVNSKRFAKTAVEYESAVQIKMLERGEVIHKTTMLFDPEKGETRPMRKKETENDYRYFPEPDLAPILLSPEKIAKIGETIDYLPDTLKTTLINEHQLASHHAEILTEEKSYGVDYISLSKNVENKKELADLVVLKLLPEAKEKGISITKVLTQSQITELIDLISEGKISKSAAYQNLLPELLTNQNESVAKLAASLNLLTSENQDFVDGIIDKIMADFPDKVKEYKSGKKGLIGFFVGQVVKEAGGKADPKLVNEKVSKALL